MAAAASTKTGELIYQASGLKKQFDNGKVIALRGLDLEIRQGEFVAIIGQSGCGKSTLLQMLGSLDKPSEGSLTYRGRSLPDMEDLPAYRSQEIGIIFQSFHLLPTFTVIENVQIPMFEGKATRAERKARATELLESVGLGHRLGHFPSELSGGERQRVAIARSLVNQPSVLLADEPTGNLDSVSAVQIIDLLSDLQEKLGVTLILVTHDPSVAARASRIIQMKDGQVISDQSADIQPSLS